MYRAFFLSMLMVAMVLVTMTTASPGGIRPLAVNREDAQNMALLAVQSMGSEYTLINVTDARIQVVAGYMYHLQMKIRQVRANTEPTDLTCKVKVHTKLWSDFVKLTQFCCTVHVTDDDEYDAVH